MDKKSKILLAVVFLFIVASIGATYWRIFIKKDYVIENQIDCDPYTENCFIWECDPTSIVEGEACIGDPESDIWYYQIARRSAANIPMCGPEADETCDPWTCAEGEADCEEILCNDTNAGEQGAECNDPVQYALDNPEEEEEVAECEEGDEECLAAQEEIVECEEGDEECLASFVEVIECEDGDEECSAAASEESSECDSKAEDCSEAILTGSEKSETENQDTAGDVLDDKEPAIE